MIHLTPRDGELLLAALGEDQQALAAEARHWLDRGDADAHRALVQAYPDRGSIDVRSVDWWVYARIAEELGLDETARRLYRRVLAGDGGDGGDGEEPADLSFASTGQLAQRGLDRLAAGGTTPGTD